MPRALASLDRTYTAALRSLRDAPTVERYQKLTDVLGGFIPLWPVHGSYFPLVECGLTLSEIAYCNVARCRATDNRPPGRNLSDACFDQHFRRWIDLLELRVVVFIGKWAANRVSHVVDAAGIPKAFMNRLRSLSSLERVANRQSVVDLVIASRLRI